MRVKNGLIIKKCVNIGPLKKYFTCILMSFSPPFTFVNFTLSLPLCYSLKIRNYTMRENIFCIYDCDEVVNNFLCKYYIVILDTLIGSLLDGFCLLLAAILSDLHVKKERLSYRKGI